MATLRVALIGHSGAGKTACLSALGVEPLLADMDAVLGTAHCPSSRVLVVSNHENLLKEMLRAKLCSSQSPRFDRFLLVYLRKPLEEIRRDLLKRTAGGGARPVDGAQYTIDNYDRLHTLYSDLADRTVRCEGKSVAVVAAEVWGVASSIDGKSI